MKDFVNKRSIVRQIWGKADTILFIFAGASAEFALNKAVDWLYFTGKLPADPLGRLFSTVSYARMIIFAEYDEAIKAIDQIAAIHKHVEAARGTQIPAWAYRDVLFMLIDYSIRSYELLDRKLSDREKEEVFNVFYHVGNRMGILGLPTNYTGWLLMRESHMQTDMLNGDFTKDLYKQYRRHLGPVRYQLLKQVQLTIVPPCIRSLLHLDILSLLAPILWIYKLLRRVKLDWILREAILPAEYRVQIRGLG